MPVRVSSGRQRRCPSGNNSPARNHTLPTSGAARFASPLGVHTFLKRTSILSLNRGDLEMLRDACVRLAEMEGLGEHAPAGEVRFEWQKGGLPAQEQEAQPVG